MFIVIVLVAAAYLGPTLGFPVLGCITAGTVVLATDFSIRAGARSFWSALLLAVTVGLLMVGMSAKLARLLPQNETTSIVTVWLKS